MPAAVVTVSENSTLPLYPIPFRHASRSPNPGEPGPLVVEPAPEPQSTHAELGRQPRLGHPVGAEPLRPPPPADAVRGLDGHHVTGVTQQLHARLDRPEQPGPAPVPDQIV